MARFDEGKRRLRLVLLLTMMALAGGCSWGPEGSPPRLVHLSHERSAELAAAVAGPAGSVEPSDASTSPDAIRLPTTEIGPESFATGAMIEGFVATCRAEQAVAKGADGGTEEEAPGELLASYGNIYRGTRPKTLEPMPDDNVFRWVEGNPEYLDPNKISEASGTAIASQLFETLLALAPGNTPPRPGQAERYEVSADGMTYTFHLRPGLVWSDGTPITAETFRGSWLRGLDPRTASTNAVQLWYIAGAEAYNTGVSTDPTTVGLRALDDLTLEVQLTAPTPFFSELVTYIAYAPVPLHVVERYGTQWTRVEHMVANGPFVMTEWRPRSRVVMKRNARYWDADHVALDGTAITISDSEARNVLLYDTGQAHYINPVPLTIIRDGLTEGRDDLHIDQQMCTYYYVFNMRRAPFDDRRVRLAFDAGFDKAGLTRDVLSAFQPPAANLLPDMFRGTLGYASVPGPQYDLALARDQLAAAGYPGGRGLPTIGLIYNTFEGHKLIAEYFDRDMRAGLGISLDVRNMEWKSLLKQVLAGDYQLARTSWCADYPDPLTFLSVFISDSPNNYSRYTNPAYDGLIDRIRRETDGVKRNALVCAAEKALNRDLPILPIYFYTRAYLLRPEVRGFLPQYSNRHNLKWVSLAGEGQR